MLCPEPKLYRYNDIGIRESIVKTRENNPFNYFGNSVQQADRVILGKNFRTSVRLVYWANIRAFSGRGKQLSMRIPLNNVVK